MTKGTKTKGIIIVTLAALTSIYIWSDEFIAISWLAFYYVILPISGFYVIKSYLSYRENTLQNKQKLEELKRERILEENRKNEKLERKRILEEKHKKEELERINLRDSDCQDEPYTYEVKGTHPNEQFAIRYGIANNSNKIRLKKLKKLQNDYYEVELTDYRDRHAIVVIEKGTEYVKTFLPMDNEWFKKHEDLELTLKGNGSFTLKELATFHVQKIINS